LQVYTTPGTTVAQPNQNLNAAGNPTQSTAHGQTLVAAPLPAAAVIATTVGYGM
jgi:hypothetical protein